MVVGQVHINCQEVCFLPKLLLIFRYPFIRYPNIRNYAIVLTKAYMLFLYLTILTQASILFEYITRLSITHTRKQY